MAANGYYHHNDCLFHIPITTAPKLKELAVVAAVLAWDWKHYDLNLNDLFDPSGKYVIDKCVKKMSEEKEKWFNYLKKILSSDILENVDEELIMVWYQNGTLNYEKTAKNMTIKCHELSDLEKFKIAALFCLQEEMREMMPRLLERHVLNCENFSFSSNPTFYYWYCFYRNELYKIRISRFSSFEKSLFMNNDVDNWTAKEYFFKFSKYPAQNAMLLMEKWPQLAKLILLHLDENQQMIFILNHANEIMRCLRLYYSDEDLLWAWSHKINGYIDKNQFSLIFKNLIIADTKEHVLKIIWNDVSIVFKRHTLSSQDYEIVNLILHSWIWNETSYFICDVLKVAKNKTRKQIASKEFFKNYFKKIILNTLSSNTLLKLCFSNDEDLFSFEKSLFL
ncbi:uncharacterized protein LOC135834629 [Planococcus citri]|uniref:uncharacterized protein LOC135834629 n=1 Tax=Planococcus citri TaxID=170843 RepID=UPI0031F8A24C